MVISGKGGVGKTTLCVGIGAGLCRRGKRVLLVEGDMGFRNMDILLGFEGNIVYDFSDVADGRYAPAVAILSHKATGLQLLPAATSPEYLPPPGALEALCRQMGEAFDFIVFDCGAGYSSLSAQLAQVCQLALVVTTPEESSVRAASRVSGFVAKDGLIRQRLIINMIPPTLALSAAIRDLDDVIDLTGVQLIGALPKVAQPPVLTSGLRSSDLFCRGMDNIAGRLLGEEIELLYRT